MEVEWVDPHGEWGGAEVVEPAWFRLPGDMGGACEEGRGMRGMTIRYSTIKSVNIFDISYTN